MSATYDFDCECDNFEMLEDQDVFTMNEGIPGPGVPAGGSAGQILQKRSQEDYDTEWVTPDGYVPAGGSAGQILKKSSAENYDTEWDSLDAGDVSFDSSLTYAAGSVGKEICDVKNTLNHKADVIYDTASGDIASFPDGADGLPVKDLTVGIEPVQDLHGYDYPWPAGGGKNLLSMTVANLKSLNTSGSWSGNVYTVSNVTFTLQTDDGENVTGIKVNGTANAQILFYCGIFIPTAETSIKFNGIPGTGSQSTYSINLLIGSSYAGDIYSGDSSANTISANTNVKYFIVIRSGYNAQSLMFYPMIRLASVSDATFAPYSNICPISGWTGCNVTRTGKNLLDTSKWLSSATDVNVTSVRQEDGNYILNNTSTGVSWIHIGPNSSYFLPVGLPYGTYTIKWNNPASKLGLYINESADQNMAENITYTGKIDTIRIIIRGNNKTFTNQKLDIRIEVGSSASDWKPYQGTAIPISWQSEAGTVYGGTLDVTTGVLTVDRAYVEYDGSNDEPWNYEVASGGKNAYIKITDAKILQFGSSSLLRCNEGKINPGASAYAETCFISGTGNFNYTYLDALDISSAEGFKTWLSSHPMQVLYELATPQTFQLDPVTVETLLGQNNIWADTGSTTCVYGADTKLYIDKKLAALVAVLS